MIFTFYRLTLTLTQTNTANQISNILEEERYNNYQTTQTTTTLICLKWANKSIGNNAFKSNCLHSFDSHCLS